MLYKSTAIGFMYLKTLGLLLHNYFGMGNKHRRGRRSNKKKRKTDQSQGETIVASQGEISIDSHGEMLTTTSI